MGEISNALRATTKDAGGEKCDTKAPVKVNRANGDSNANEKDGRGASEPSHNPPPQETVDDSRAIRIKVLDEIVTSLESKKPTWHKTRILHLSTQLEQSMFTSKESLEEYADSFTLQARINRHCLLLATKKTASPPLQGLAASTNVVSHGRVQLRSLPEPLVLANPSQLLEGGPGSDGYEGGNRDVDDDEVPVAEEAIKGNQAYEPAGIAQRSPCAVAGAGKGIGVGGGSTEGKGAVPGRDLSHEEEEASSMEHDGCTMWPPLPSLSLAQPVSVTHTEPPVGREQGAQHHERHHSADRALKDHQNYSLNSPHSLAPNGVGEVTEQQVDSRAANENSGSLGDEHLSSGTVLGGGGAANRQVETGVDGGQTETVEGDVGAVDVSAMDVHAVSVDAVDRDDYGSKERDAAQEEMKQHALRLLQCRMLLLTHSSKCTEEEGGCQLSPLCDSVRHLFRHMRACEKKKACEFPHCDSSKAVLRHQHACNDTGCILCAGVRDLAQKCFWANARHAHKRRLQESHELRRKKRQSEGKPVAPPRKQTEKAKTGRETCSGLDEAGNDLGDISLGFFLRQDKAVKARKLSRENAASKAGKVLPGKADANTTGGVMPLAEQQGLELRDATAVANATVAPAPPPSPEDKIDTSHTAHGGVSAAGSPKKQTKSRGEGHNASATSQPIATPVVPRSPRPHPLSSGELKGVAHHNEDTPGGGAEAHAIAAASGGGRGPAARGGGLTVVIPLTGVMAGHLRSPSEIMLDEIAESLADTTRKPSFARMQSVQAFLDEHGELRESASFGDVSALVEQWMSLDGDDNPPNDEPEHLGLSSAFSF